jgi:hypothetical protein
MIFQILWSILISFKMIRLNVMVSFLGLLSVAFIQLYGGRLGVWFMPISIIIPLFIMSIISFAVVFQKIRVDRSD